MKKPRNYFQVEEQEKFPQREIPPNNENDLASLLDPELRKEVIIFLNSYSTLLIEIWITVTRK